MITQLNHIPQIGDIVAGHQVTEVRADGAVFGVKGTLPKSEIKKLAAHFQSGARGFIFRPGYQFAKLAKASKAKASESFLKALGFTEAEERDGDNELITVYVDRRSISRFISKMSLDPVEVGGVFFSGVLLHSPRQDHTYHVLNVLERKANGKPGKRIGQMHLYNCRKIRSGVELVSA